jgi:threonine synthase
VLPQEFRGLLEKERRVIDVDEPSEELVKKVIESKANFD